MRWSVGQPSADTNSAHSVVLTALEKDKSAKALAERIWRSFVVEGNNKLYRDDLLKAMGTNRQQEAKTSFDAIDRLGNGDISLNEMILTVTDYARQRKSINSSMHDVNQAIDALDGLILAVAIIVCIVVLGTYTKTILRNYR
jgi:Ca2+-binding EF-hand superfamily protein